MKLRDIIKLFGIHMMFFIVGFLLFCLSFRTFLFKSMDVLFFRGLMLLMVVCIIVALLFFILKKIKFNKLITYRDIILSVAIIMGFNIVFFTHLPITAERSVSVFILGYMDENSERWLSKDDMKKEFVAKYVDEYGAIESRFHEQIVAGNIVKDGQKYKISQRGKMLMDLYDKIADIFMINKKIIHPK